VEASEAATVTHHQGLVASGSAGPEVHQLMVMLGNLGYPSDLYKGQNPHSICGPSETQAIAAFQTDKQITEEPQTLAVSHPGAAGPVTWQAVLDAHQEAQKGS
jgi:peptidoglycan hydrolase-like protein with peptidoglycan-binding domain